MNISDWQVFGEQSLAGELRNLNEKSGSGIAAEPSGTMAALQMVKSSETSWLGLNVDTVGSVVPAGQRVTTPRTATVLIAQTFMLTDVAPSGMPQKPCMRMLLVAPATSGIMPFVYGGDSGPV